jgi:ubiquinol-cytochrome c reductase cytochrome c subunit
VFPALAALQRAARAPRLLVALPLVVTALVTPALVAGAPTSQPEPTDAEQVAAGRELFLTGCASCHGPDGKGVTVADDVRGPSLVESGAAGAYYYLSTGRMPLADSDDQPVRKPPAYSPREIDALVAYVASLDDGPEIPDVDIAQGDLAAGGEIFRGNCQACHTASGSGGALSYGRAAPSLAHSTPKQIGSAVRVGPGQMPVFGPDVIDEQQLNDLARYVVYLRRPADPGGLPIGRTGPIPEGFVAWLIGLVALLVLVAWIGTRSRIRDALRPATATATATTGGGADDRGGDGEEAP